MAKKEPTKKSAPKVKYENNPFFVASNGITLLFNSALGVTILLLALAVINFFTRPSDNSSDPDQAWEKTKRSWDTTVHTVSNWSLNDWLLAVGSVAIIGLALIMVSALISAIASYTSYKLSRGENVKLSGAFRVAFDNLWGFIWLQAIVFAKIILWSLLFVIPGIIMAFRYSLANVAFFDERKELRGNAAVKESLRLTKGAWITTFSSNMLFNFLSFGMLSGVVSTAVNAVLYRQFGDLGDKRKPDAHWLSWVTLAVPFLLVLFGITILLSFVLGLAVGFKFSE